jgi:hypothetical protein
MNSRADSDFADCRVPFLLICWTVFAIGPYLHNREVKSSGRVYMNPLSRMKAKCSDCLTLLNDANFVEVEDLKNETCWTLTRIKGKKVVYGAEGRSVVK